MARRISMDIGPPLAAPANSKETAMTKFFNSFISVALIALGAMPALALSTAHAAGLF